MAATSRLQAVQELIASFREKYSEDDFFLHDGLEFVYNPEHGVHIKVTADIPQGESLI